MMKVYLAARYALAPKMQGYVAHLERLGHTITSRWHSRARSASIQALDADSSPLADKSNHAHENIHDIDICDTFIQFTEGPEYVAPGNDRGGRHFEFGYAYHSSVYGGYQGKEAPERIIIIGPRENVFHWLEKVEQFDTWEAFIDHLKTEAHTEYVRKVHGMLDQYAAKLTEWGKVSKKHRDKAQKEGNDYMYHFYDGLDIALSKYTREFQELSRNIAGLEG